MVEGDVIEWIGEAIESIGYCSIYEQAVSFMEIRNHRAELPKYIQSIIQAARDREWTNTDCLTPSDVLTSIHDTCGCHHDTHEAPHRDPVVDCDGNPVMEEHIHFYRPYFSIILGYNFWSATDLYKRRYVPIRLATHNFFKAQGTRGGDIYHSATDEYNTYNGTLITSFQEGSIALSYWRIMVNEQTGFPMIPDDIFVIEAITNYIIYKYMRRNWYLGRDGFLDKMQKAEIDWNYSKTKASTSLKDFSIDAMENIGNERNKLVRSNNVAHFNQNTGKAPYEGLPFLNPMNIYR
jgi:hypothetical protein